MENIKLLKMYNKSFKFFFLKCVIFGLIVQKYKVFEIKTKKKLQSSPKFFSTKIKYGQTTLKKNKKN